jgi:dTDP-4-dehydrorhamnose reductase
MLNNGITHLVNCVGFTGRPNIDEAENKKEECWFLNVVFPLKISALCKKIGVNYIHISSGCIYTGYEKEWEENDAPNFGLYNDSSFYSKTKHAFETLNGNNGLVIRVRMPFGNTLSPRNYLTKILKYDTLIDYINSKTYIPDLCNFINYVIHMKRDFPFSMGPLNFVNPNPLVTSDVIKIMRQNGVENPNWKMVDISEIPIVAPRSNCVLSMNRFFALFPDFNINDEAEALHLALSGDI